MLSVEIDEGIGVAILQPNGELTAEDFTSAARVIDPYLESNGNLKGIVIHVESFPGWDSFAALAAHLKFVRDHHRRISRIAFATDSPVGAVAEAIASHFVSAEIRDFSFAELGAAKQWVAG